MQQAINELTLNGIIYVPKGSGLPELPKDGYSIVRCPAGIFFGYVSELSLYQGTAIIKDAKRLWYWTGAASLSQLAVDGTAKPKDCKVPCAVPSVSVTGVIEVIPCTDAAIKSINSIPVWKQ